MKINPSASVLRHIVPIARCCSTGGQSPGPAFNHASSIGRLYLVLAALMSMDAPVWAVTESFNASTIWTCPAGVTMVTVECWGGGGAGGSAVASSAGPSGTATDGGGGAGGAYAMKSSISVIHGNTYAVNVGMGGVADPVSSIVDGNHGDGGDSWFNSASIVLAKGGGGGITRSATRPAQGDGGACPLGSIGDTINLGGSGAAGDGSAPASGGGGGSGGTLSAGNSANGVTGGAAVTGGGAGANGVTAGSGGKAGVAPGGGGSGAQSGSATGQQGGAGAGGKVVITYSLPASTYAWVATTGSADWTSAASWSPNRTTPAANDVLLFNAGGTSTATSVPVQTIGKLQVSGDTIIHLQSGAPGNSLTIGETAADALAVASGSELNVNGANAMTLHVSTGAKASISGVMTFSAATNTLTAADAGGITFNAGAAFTQAAGNTGNIFGGSGTAGTVVFASGSTFNHQAGSNPFGLSQPNSKVVFQTGSLFRLQQSATPSVSGRLYADFEYNVNAASSGGGSSPLAIDNLSVAQGTLSLAMTGGYNQNGNISVSPGATLLLNGNGMTTASGKSITVNGTLGGTNSMIGGDASVSITSSGTLAPGATASSIGTLTFTVAPALGGTILMEIDRNAGSPIADKVARSGGNLVYGGALTVANIGSDLVGGEVFDLFDAASFSGEFASASLPALGGSLNWWLGELTTDGTIRVNRSPAANDDAKEVHLGQTTTLPAGKLLANDTDADGDTLTITDANATGGSASVVGGNIEYTPPGSGASDTITYIVSDGCGGADSATVTVTLLPAPGAQGYNRLSVNGGEMTYLGIPGTSYALEHTEILNPASWVPVITNQAATNGYLKFTNSQSGFFRTRHVSAP